MKTLIENIYENRLNDNQLYDNFQQVVEKEYTSKELFNIITFIKNKQKIIVDLPNSIDVCGTGGSGLDRLNTSTLTAIKLSKQGIKVAKHGNKASSGKFGSFDLLKELNYDIPETEDQIKQFYNENTLVFLYANLLYPFLLKLSELRKQYNKPTIFNILGPLLSPANSKIHLTGCGFEDKMELMVETFKLLGKEKVLVVRGKDGLDEITLSNNTDVFELNNGKIKNYEICPEEFGFKKVALNRILISDNTERLEISKNIINGNESSPYNDLIDLNIKVVKEILIKY